MCKKRYNITLRAGLVSALRINVCLFLTSFRSEWIFSGFRFLEIQSSAATRRQDSI